MCCNVLGLGALNILLILQGLFAVVMNIMPFSTDCEMAAESFFGQEGYTCNQVEKMLNASWINAYITMGLWMMVLGALPKLSKDFSAEANKLVCLVTCIMITINQVGNIIMVMTIPIEGSDPTFMYAITGLWFVCFGIAFFVHKDPSSGAKMY